MVPDDEGRLPFRYRLDEDESPSTGVYSAVASLEDRSPTTLTPLGEVTDPDALDAMLSKEPGAASVSFRYCGYVATVTAEAIRLESPGDE